MSPVDTKRSRRRRLLAPLLVALAAALLFVRLPDLLERTDPLPERADAIYVFPGEIPARPLCAVDLWRRGIAGRVVFTGGSPDRTLSALGEPVTDAEVGARIAARGGLPRDAAVVLEEGTSTWEDAAALARWAERSGVRSIVAVTSPLHARRAGRSLGLALRSGEARAVVVACGPRLREKAWWWDEKSLVAVVVETAKSLLYEVRYFFPSAFGLA